MTTTETTGKSIMDRQYDTLRVRDKSGKLHYVRGNHDAVLKALALHTIVNGKDIEQVARANKIDLADYVNPGQMRMALGNKLRARVRKGEQVTIGALTISSLDDHVELPTEEPGEASPPAPKAAQKKDAKAKPAKAAKTAGKPLRRKAAA